MNAQSFGEDAESSRLDGIPLPDWVFPPPEGLTADSFIRMRGLPRHTELIDGSLVFPSRQTKWHSHVVSLLTGELDRQAPEDRRAIHDMTIRLAERQAPEPDALLVAAEVCEPDLTYFLPEHVTLAAEVVSPASEDRDRYTKPLKYAAAGIKHFWRVEFDDYRTVVYVHELDPATGSYVPTGIHRDRLKLTVPFDIDIDLTAVGKRV